GLFILLFGAAWLLRQMSFPVPYWLFTWPMILIGIGLLIGIKHGFRNSGWFVLILLGCVFLIGDAFPDIMWHQYLWPIALIVLGAFLIIRPRRRKWNEWQQGAQPGDSTKEKFSGEDMLNYNTAFGGLKKNILSKDFKGGYVSNVFGGTELNFMQADIQGTVMLEVSQVFGGTKLIVPAHWEIRSDMSAIFGGIDDKRVPSPNVDHSKVLVLKGSTTFGGIEIVSY
ncbi:MAG: hypothetical protein ACHQD9_03790, partial [Chitinophagales bacterium]